MMPRSVPRPVSRSTTSSVAVACIQLPMLLTINPKKNTLAFRCRSDRNIIDCPERFMDLVVQLERVDEDVAWHLDPTDRLHLLLALFLLLEQLAFSGDVAAIALG